MANVSDWKGFEKQVAEALGGKRRLRTMESYGKEAPDVYWPKKFRHSHPVVKQVIVECKKRKALNVHGMFTEAKLKYGKADRRLILATRIPATKGGLKKFRKMKVKLAKRHGRNPKDIKLKTFIAPLVTVELPFFRELWRAWLVLDS